MTAVLKEFLQTFSTIQHPTVVETWAFSNVKKGGRVYLLCVARKTAVSKSSAKYRERWNHREISQETKPPSPCSQSATVDRRGHFLYAQPKPVVPHCTSPLMFSQIQAKLHCYNKQLRTCRIDGPFRDILAAGRCSTTKVLAFLSALKLRL